jgi:hypothetical protein
MEEDLTKWSVAALREALYEVDDERKLWERRVRKNGVPTEKDLAEMEAMNTWASKLFEEITKRR